MKRALALLLLLLPVGARAQLVQCPAGTPSGTIGCQPAAVSPLPTDQFLTWQIGQAPHTRSLPIGSASVTGNSVTSNLSTWAGYLAGGWNPNTVNVGDNPYGPTAAVVAFDDASNTFPYAVQRIDLISSASGGTAYNVSSGLIVNVTVSGTPNVFLWGVNATVTSSAIGIGQEVAMHASGVRLSIPAGGSGNMAQVFGAGISVEDDTNTSLSVSGSTVGLEVDNYGGGLDNYDAEGIRNVLDLRYGKRVSADSTFSVGAIIQMGRASGDGFERHDKSGQSHDRYGLEHSKHIHGCRH